MKKMRLVNTWSSGQDQTDRVFIKPARLSISLILVIAAMSCEEDAVPETSSITYVNNTQTTVTLTVNGQTQDISAGKNIVLTGKSGQIVSGTASTSGKTSSGIQVGGKVTWTVNDTYPKSGNLTTDFSVNSDLFFLKIINNSSYTITKVYVNYGLQSQTLDNLSIPNDGKTYSIGYYYAYANSNIRLEAGNINWNAVYLSLPNTDNQVFTFTAK